MTATRKYELYSKEFRQNSHAVFAQMRASDPVFKQAGLDGSTPIWFVTRYDEAQQILLDDARFVLDPRLVFNEEEQQGIFGMPEPLAAWIESLIIKGRRKRRKNKVSA